MNVQGRSDFTVETELTPDEVRAEVNRIVRAFAARTPAVTRAVAEADDALDITIKIGLVSGSFALLESELDELAKEISDALQRRSATTRVSRGVTEMVTA